MIHVNELKFKGETPWVKQFNLCSDLWQKATDESLSEEEREEAVEMWTQERWMLEQGYLEN